ncbi:hypothetical protein LshimejAT787_0600990 [Lyophyllum shimeji]|uniref:Uncharacterized protein n=1 Tax=Lyophyllum shimeji TaxID=47721 RepID=A0A9P3UN38_LYOSH|nr:hypothetical protein LshimejAT787_0600990 [Lyophyllum shimeji]
MFCDIDETAAYLRQFENTLTSLTLKKRSLSYNHVRILAEAFASKNILERLNIAVYSLSPSLLVLLAEKLSNLQSLYLRHRYRRSPSAYEVS